MDPTSATPSAGPGEPRCALAALPAYSVFAFFLAGQLTLAAVLQLASIPLGLAVSELFLFAAPAFLLARAANFRPGSFLALRPAPSWRLVGLGALAGAANFLLAGGLQILGRALVPAEVAQRYDAAHLFQGIQGVELGLVVASLAVFAPVCEEIGFRGWIQPVLKARRGGRGPTAVVLTAVLFAVLHLDPIGLAARIELGVLFGLLALWTRSLWPAIAAHAANNAIAAGLLVHAVTAPDRGAQRPTAPLQAVALGLAGLVGVALVLWAVRRLTARLPDPAPEPVDPTQDHHPKASRAGLWLPAWLIATLACSAVLMVLRWTAFQVAVADAATPPQAVLKRLPDDEARKKLERKLVEAKSQAQSGAVDLEAYKAMRKRLSDLGKADAGGLTLGEVEAELANHPPAPPAELEGSPR